MKLTCQKGSQQCCAKSLGGREKCMEQESVKQRTSLRVTQSQRMTLLLILMNSRGIVKLIDLDCACVLSHYLSRHLRYMSQITCRFLQACRVGNPQMAARQVVNFRAHSVDRSHGIRGKRNIPRRSWHHLHVRCY